MGLRRPPCYPRIKLIRLTALHERRLRGDLVQTRQWYQRNALGKHPVFCSSLSQSGPIRGHTRRLSAKASTRCPQRANTFTKFIENKLEYPFNKCHKEKSTHNYHQDNCIDSCISEKIAIKYNCTQPGYYQMSQKSTCAEGRGFHQEFKIQCEQVCPEACDKTIYDVAIFTKSMNDKFTSDDKIKKKLLLVSASYSDLNYVAITQIPKSTMFDFISVIGGKLNFIEFKII